MLVFSLRGKFSVRHVSIEFKQKNNYSGKKINFNFFFKI